MPKLTEERVRDMAEGRYWDRRRWLIVSLNLAMLLVLAWTVKGLGIRIPPKGTAPGEVLLPPDWALLGPALFVMILVFFSAWRTQRSALQWVKDTVRVWQRTGQVPGKRRR